jgi:hypothetical protein
MGGHLQHAGGFLVLLVENERAAPEELFLALY